MAYLVDGIRTPIGRYAGVLSAVRPTTSRRTYCAPCGRGIHRWTGPPWTMSSSVASTRRERTTATLPGWRYCSPGCPTPCRARRSIAYAVQVLTPLRSRHVRSGPRGDLAIAGGVESMSRSPFVMPKAAAPFARGAEIYDTTMGWRFVNPAMQAAYGTDSMGETAEIVAAERGVSRADQDAFALRSQQRAAKAQGRSTSRKRSRRFRCRSARATRCTCRRTSIPAKQTWTSSPGCDRRSATAAPSPPETPPA